MLQSLRIGASLLLSNIVHCQEDKLGGGTKAQASPRKKRGIANSKEGHGVTRTIMDVISEFFFRFLTEEGTCLLDESWRTSVCFPRRSCLAERKEKATAAKADEDIVANECRQEIERGRAFSNCVINCQRPRPS